MRRFLYRYFRSLSSVQYWLRRRFTKAGLLVLGALLASAVLGLDTNRTMAYQAFTLLLGLIVVSIVSSLWFRAKLSIERLVPRCAAVGQPLSYRIRVYNEQGRPLPGLVLLENLADPRPSFQEFIEAPERADEGRNWVDRTIGYPRWQALIAKNRPAVIEQQPLPPLPSNSETEIRVECTPLRRGLLRFDGVTVARPDPFGLFNSFVMLPLPETVSILPKRYPVPKVTLPGSRTYQHGGVALASSVGDSEEFVSMRPYRPGDPLRRIHWRSWAKLGQPIVKEYQDEFFVRHALVLDTFQREEQDAVFEEAVSVAASFACTVETQESVLDLLFVGPEAYCVTVGRGIGPTEHLLEVLACLGPCRAKPFQTLHDLIMERSASLTDCLCVFLCWDEARQNLVRSLHALDIPTMVLLITDAGSSATQASTLPDDEPTWLHRLEVGRIAEGLAAL